MLASMPTARCIAKLAILLALAGVGGCNSPTLPLPPPSTPEEITVSGDGTHVELAGSGAQPGALVLVFNDELTVLAGAIATANSQGQYRMTVPVDLSVHAQNQLEMWQRLGTEDSSLVTFSVRRGESRGPNARADAGADVEPPPPDGEAATSDADAQP
jgi:hypothetical protein